MLDVKNISVYYDKVCALSNISFHVDESEIVSVIGANGAGKTTTVQMCSTLLTPTSGSLTVNGVDAIVFTAGIGENVGMIREKVCSYLGYLGVKIDDEANNVRGERRVISAADSKVKVMLIPTNEELAIARETLRLTK